MSISQGSELALLKAVHKYAGAKQVNRLCIMGVRLLTVRGKDYKQKVEGNRPNSGLLIRVGVFPSITNCFKMLKDRHIQNKQAVCKPD